jgi:hypothetical protein
MKERSRIDNIVSSKFYPLLLFFVSFVFVMLFSRSTSFLYVFEGGDPAIFKQMGLAMLRGKILYIDYFDNKGCILYFIQALGLWLGDDFFILLMQTVSLTITLVIWDKMLALYRDGRSRLICLGVALVLLLCFYQDGDLTEEWCLPFASYPLLVYFQSLKSEKDIRFGEMFAIGICFGIITFIRINNASPLLGFVAYSWLLLLLNKNFGRFFKSLSCFLSGLFIIAGSCVLYFYLKAGWHGVYEMIYGSFLSNFEYMALEVEIQSAYVYIVFSLFLVLCIAQQILNSAKDKTILLPTLLSYGVFILSSGNRCFTHYLIAILPLVIVLMMSLPHIFIIKRNIAFCVLLFESVCLYLPIPFALAVNDLVLKNDKYSVIYDNFHRCIEDIPEVERDSIYNYNLLGNGAGMMQHEGLLQCNRVFFSTFAFSMPTLRKEEDEKPMISPKWIMVAWENYFTDDDAYFILDNYDEVFSFEHDRVYFEKPKIGNCFTVHLFRRKD